ncbi:adaptin N terminal region-domain-containing protein [Pavlovales sp. CCMP2436]|nr:adaptin N terminal region-domain-containing protein [Pavlovales sp. CCMP2436]
MRTLKDADVSIRRRALDLVYSMCDYSNCRETIAELLSYLANADFSLREELVLKIAILAERFADDYAWYVDVVLALMKTAGEQVSDEIWYRVVQIITNEEALQKYATENVFKALLDDTRPPNNLVRICAYLLGEFGHLWATSDMPTRALLLSTYVKLGHIYPELEGDVARVFNTCRSTLDQYSALSSPGLADLKRIKVRSNDETGRGRGDIVADKIAREDSAGEAHHTSR